MSFANKHAVYCIDDQFQYCQLNTYIKILVVLKRQQFKDSKSDAIKPKASKCIYMDKHNNEERQGLDKYQDSGSDSGNRYISLLFYL